MRIFLDTNVIVSAVTARGLCADVFRFVIAEHELLIGEVVLDELRQVLPERMKAPPALVSAVERFLREQVVIPKPAFPHPLPTRDVSDRWILASALDAKADVLVTGDSDLLDITSELPLRIMTPRDFWNFSRRISNPTE